MTELPLDKLIEALRMHAAANYGRSKNGLGEVCAQAADALTELAPVALAGPRHLADNGLDVLAMPQDRVTVVDDEEAAGLRFLLVEHHGIGGSTVVGRMRHFDRAHRCALVLSQDHARQPKGEEEEAE